MELLVTVIGHLHHFSVNLSYKVIFFFLHMMAILENLTVMIENVMIALGGKMAIMETLFANLEYFTNSFHNKFILYSENQISIASFISRIYLCMEKPDFLANGNTPDYSLS